MILQHLMMEYKPQSKPSIAPRLVIHGGAGNILPVNLPPARYKQYHDSLLHILCTAHHYLTQPSSSSSPTTSLDAVTYAVTLLENNPLFNSGHGAVFTRDGINELEASIMVSRGKKKRGVGVMGLQHVKNPIRLVREMLLRGEKDLEGGNGEHRRSMALESTGAQGHSQLHKYSAEKLAAEWGLEMVDPEYFFVQSRWDEHIKGLEQEKNGSGVATWDLEQFFPQGTCGAVALDADGVLTAGTSTGGMTNKLTGRIGDTPTLGAGFWAEEWEEMSSVEESLRAPGPQLILSETLRGLMADCLPSLTAYTPVSPVNKNTTRLFRSTAISGTGNGDSFLRTAAARTASAIARYRGCPLQSAVSEVSGPGGELVKSAGDRWRKTGEGEGGVIGIELTYTMDENLEQLKSAKSDIVYDFNCGGMFRAAVGKDGKAVMRVWKEGQHEGLAMYEGEGKRYDVREWLDEKIIQESDHR
jgi:L-asparaginase